MSIDVAEAEAPELIRWLAEQPCPGRDADTACTWTLFCICKGSGLAFPWASEECGVCADTPGRRWNARNQEIDCSNCSPSGRVPKAVGLEELFEHGVHSVIHKVTKAEDYEATMCKVQAGPAVVSYGETPLLAALRAVCKSLA